MDNTKSEACEFCKHPGGEHSYWCPLARPNGSESLKQLKTLKAKLADLRGWLDRMENNLIMDGVVSGHAINGLMQDAAMVAYQAGLYNGATIVELHAPNTDYTNPG